MKRIARFAIRRRWWVLAGWLVALVAVQSIAGALGGADYKNDFSLPGTETNQVVHLLEQAGQDDQSGFGGQVVLHTDRGNLEQAPTEVTDRFAALCAKDIGVNRVATPWQKVTCFDGRAAISPGQPTLLSKDGSTAIAEVDWAAENADVSQFTAAYEHLETLRNDHFEVAFTGDVFAGVDQGEGGSAVLIGFLAAFVILAIVFRTVGATALPLLGAAAALTGGLALIAMLSHAMSVPDVTPQLTQLMVIGVGVDYALFIVTRHRRNLRRGMGVEASIEAAIDTSGRAVLFAGTTVCIAMLGLVALGVGFFYGMAIGTAVAVGLTMVASLSLLPAMLRILGLRVLTRRHRRAVRAGEFIGAEEVGGWAKWSALVSRRRVALGAIGAIVVVVLAVPMLSMRLGHADQGNDPSGSTTREGYDLIAQHFGPGYNSTLTLVVDGPDAHATAERLGATIGEVDDVDPASVFVAPQPLTSELSLVSLKSQTAPQDEATTELVHHLRDDVLPPVYEGTANHVYVFGGTAVQVDFAQVLGEKMPLFIGAVVGLSFVLLLVAFRSLVVPLTAAIMNLLAAGASFGVVVALFQWGWFSDLLGSGGGGPIEPWAPVLFFAIIFGLSMDYQVFLVSRIHEEWVHSGDNEQAVRVGQGTTGGIITAAATIMIAVFAGFLLEPVRVIKLLGLGLASAVFIDAFILRTVLVPSLMHLLGRSNWYFPAWLDRIVPHVSVEAPERSVEAPADDTESEWVESEPERIPV
ncbi:MAG TPA: MMPL family transporter [Acidimicrobiales bacterium]|nr:MMPL family transporter [Acidimicrobiales bacterium]